VTRLNIEESITYVVHTAQNMYNSIIPRKTPSKKIEIHPPLHRCRQTAGPHALRLHVRVDPGGGAGDIGHDGSPVGEEGHLRASGATAALAANDVSYLDSATPPAGQRAAGPCRPSSRWYTQYLVHSINCIVQWYTQYLEHSIYSIV
jgi:hypothetical protein